VTHLRKMMLEELQGRAEVSNGAWHCWLANDVSALSDAHSGQKAWE
jgi:hypothetical protein